MAQTIIITGAASGVGRVLATRLAGPGRQLLLATRKNRTGLEASAAAARAGGADVAIYLGDLAEDDVPAALVAEAVARFGSIDAIVANAGFADRTPLSELDPKKLRYAFDAIAGAFAALCHAALPHLNDGGRILAISSFVAHRFQLDGVHMPNSAAAKAALEALLRDLAVTLADRNITVNAVAPGYVQKDPDAHRAVSPGGYDKAIARIPLGRIATPEDVAGAVAFFLSPEAGYITGQVLHVDGGMGL